MKSGKIQVNKTGVLFVSLVLLYRDYRYQIPKFAKNLCNWSSVEITLDQSLQIAVKS